MHLRRLVGGRETKGRCHMKKLTRGILFAVLLAVAMLSTGATASADSGKGQKSTSATVEIRVGGVERTLNVTWE